MCLIVVSFREQEDFPLIVTANRDEFLNRPAEPLQWWDSILSGKDLSSGGTWLGENAKGKFAAVTNYREPGKSNPKAKSRGLLTKDFLANTFSAPEYAILLEKSAGEYNGYNLLFGDSNELWYFSNRSGMAPRALEPGLYGLSNHLLDTPWHKVRRAKELFRQSDKSPSALLAMLTDAAPASEDEIQETGLPREIERGLSPIFIRLEGYGTRVSTVVRMDARGGVAVTEKAHDMQSAGVQVEEFVVAAMAG